MKAEELLDDGKIAFAMLEDAEDEAHFRILWIACVTILRSIGHVLDKVDAKDPAYTSLIKMWWKSINQAKEENRIFFEFIERERNFAIKEYRLDYADGSQFGLGFEDSDGKITMFDEVSLENLYMPMTDGPYEGEDCRDIVRSAIEWWDKQIELIRATV